MGFQRKLTATILSLCSGGAAACTALYAVRSRQSVFADQIIPSADENNMTLINVQIFFRHGARTPLTIITGLNEVCTSSDITSHHTEQTEAGLQKILGPFATTSRRTPPVLILHCHSPGVATVNTTTKMSRSQL